MDWRGPVREDRDFSIALLKVVPLLTQRATKPTSESARLYESCADPNFVGAGLVHARLFTASPNLLYAAGSTVIQKGTNTSRPPRLICAQTTYRPGCGIVSLNFSSGSCASGRCSGSSSIGCK